MPFLERALLVQRGNCPDDQDSPGQEGESMVSPLSPTGTAQRAQFGFTPPSLAKPRTGNYDSSHTVGAIRDQSDLPWGQTSTFATDETAGRTATDLPHISPCSSHATAIHVCRRQPPGSLPAPSAFPLPPEPGSCASSGLCGYVSPRPQPRLPALASHPLPCARPGPAPSAVHLHDAA